MPSSVFIGSSGGGSSVIHSASVTLTDEQIKASPTTPLTIVAAPGANRRLQLVAATVASDVRGGAYTNVNALCAGQLVYAGGSIAASLIFPYFADTLVDFGAVVVNDFLPGFQAVNASFPEPFVAYVYQSAIANKEIQFVVTNAGAGNFTGGHASNTITIGVAYTVFDFSTRGYVEVSA
jgi:hypothetical protein